MRIGIDGSALGSGRGGDETLMRGILIGLAQEADPDDRFELFVRDASAVPQAVASDSRFHLRHLALSGGLARLAAELPVKIRALGKLDAMVCLTHSPLFLVCPTVLIVTDLSFHRHPEYYPRRTSVRLNLLVGAQVHRATAVATLSEFCKQDIVRAYGLNPSKVSVVPCGVEPPPRVESEGWWEEQEHWAQSRGINSPFSLYLGNLHPRKNLGRLVEAMEMGRRQSAALAAHQLVVAGARWWGDDAAEASSPEGVIFLGPVSEDQREYLLRRAAFLTYPSLFEGFGLPPIEAMLRDTPVLAANATAIPEVVGDAALLVDPTDIDDIGTALVRLAEDEALRSDFVERGRSRALRYTTAASGQALLRTLFDVASSEPLQRVQ